MTDDLAGLSDRDLAARVAEQVLGRTLRKVRYLESYSYPDGMDKPAVAHYAEAWASGCGSDDEVLYEEFDGRWRIVLNSVRPYATDLSAFVRDVVPALNAKGLFLSLWQSAGVWFARLSRDEERFYGHDASPARAACLAALRAVAGREDRA